MSYVARNSFFPLCHDLRLFEVGLGMDLTAIERGLELLKNPVIGPCYDPIFQQVSEQVCYQS